MKKVLAFSILLITFQSPFIYADSPDDLTCYLQESQNQRVHLQLFERPPETTNDYYHQADNRGRVVINNKHRTEYYSSILLGSQKTRLYVALDTGSTDIWVPGKQCSSCGCRYKAFFDEDKSDTFSTQNQVMNIRYGQGNMQGVVGYDSLSLGGLEVSHQGFGLATYISDNFKNVAFDGIFGLAYSPLSKDHLTPWIDNAVEQGVIPKAIFSFYLSNSPQNGNSRLIIGEPDPKFYQGDINWHPLVPLRPGLPKGLYYSVSMDGIAVDDENIPLTCQYHGSCSAIVDSGTSLIVGPEDDVLHILNYLNVASDCSNIHQLPDLKFKIDGVDYAVPPEFYVVKQVDYQGLEGCIAGIAPKKTSKWILGDAFMRAFYVIIDKADQKVAFSELPTRLKAPKTLRRLFHQPATTGE